MDTNDLTLLNSKAFLAPLPQQGLIAVLGTKGAEFLQGQISADVRAITNMNSSLAVHCNPKGRIIASFRLFQQDENYYLLLPKAMVANTCSTLKKYAQFFKVELQDVTEQWQCLGLTGAASIACLKRIFTAIPSIANSKAVEQDTIIFNMMSTDSSVPRFLLLGKPAIIQTLTDKLASMAEVTQATAELWPYLDIAAGLPHVLPATQELFTPHQINYQLIEGISFTKGCYTGQEIIARMQYLGKLKQHMYRIKLQTDTSPGAGELILYQEQEVGQLVNFVKLGTDQYEALAVIKDEFTFPELISQLTLAQTKGLVLKLLDLPYELN